MHLKQILKTKTQPHQIALGFAIGAFYALLPTPGFSILLGVITLLIYKKISKYALFAAMAIFNPLLQIPIYWLSYKIGDAILGNIPVVAYDVTIAYQALHVTRRYLLGNLILAITISILSYIILYYATTYYQTKHLSMHKKKS